MIDYKNGLRFEFKIIQLLTLDEALDALSGLIPGEWKVRFL